MALGFALMTNFLVQRQSLYSLLYRRLYFRECHGGRHFQLLTAHAPTWHASFLLSQTPGPQFKRHCYSSADKHFWSSGLYPYSSWLDCTDQEEEKGERDARDVANLYQHVLRFNLEKASKLLGGLSSQINRIHNKGLENLILPLLEEMMSVSVLGLTRCPPVLSIDDTDSTSRELLARNPESPGGKVP
jgi:hypothetical protein